MHSEFYQLSEEAAATLRQVKENGGRVIAVGTTSIRTLETIGASLMGKSKQTLAGPISLSNQAMTGRLWMLFLRIFHLPKSTLVMLVSAFAGRELVLEAYQHAIDQKYRFFSFGDAMFIY